MTLNPPPKKFTGTFALIFSRTNRRSRSRRGSPTCSGVLREAVQVTDAARTGEIFVKDYHGRRGQVRRRAWFVGAALQAKG
jgi:hypothetical protein